MKNVLLSCALLLVSTLGWSQCQISFSYTTSGLTATLDPTDSSSSISYNQWDAPGGTPSTQQLYVTTNANVTYSAPGAYFVCVTMFDSAWSCVDTFCDSIVIPGSAMTVNLVSNDDTCSSCTGFANVSNIQGGASPYTYQWSNSAASSSISNLCGGTYTVTVTDNNSLTATASAFIDSYNWMTANIIASDTVPQCGDTVTLSAYSNANNITYLWSNGATTQSTDVVNSGNYTVTITNMAGCASVATNSVFIGNLSIAGYLTQGSPATVYLIAQAAGTLTAIDSVSTDSLGYYYFNDLCNGTYYVKGALNNGHSQFASYIPTYYDSAALWNNSTAVILTNSSIGALNFSLLPGTNSGGAGFIGGLISQGANRPAGNPNSQGPSRGEGDPIANAVVVVYDALGQTSAYTRSDANGEFSLSNMAEGSYSVYVDILNKVAYPFEVTLSASNLSNDAVNFTVNAESIQPAYPNGVNEISETQVLVFPNPTNGQIKITAGSAIGMVKVYNTLGELVLTYSVANRSEVAIDLSFSAGTYILETSGDSFVNRQIIVVE